MNLKFGNIRRYIFLHVGIIIYVPEGTAKGKLTHSMEKNYTSWVAADCVRHLGTKSRPKRMLLCWHFTGGNLNVTNYL